MLFNPISTFWLSNHTNSTYFCFRLSHIFKKMGNSESNARQRQNKNMPNRQIINRQPAFGSANTYKYYPAPYMPQQYAYPRYPANYPGYPVNYPVVYDEAYGQDEFYPQPQAKNVRSVPAAIYFMETINYLLYFRTYRNNVIQLIIIIMPIIHIVIIIINLHHLRKKNIGILLSFKSVQLLLFHLHLLLTHRNLYHLT